MIAVLVAAGEANVPGTATMTAAALEALGPNASFVVREVAVPSDNNALMVEEDLGAAAVVEIVWSGAARTQVMLRLHLARLDRWIQREVTFLTADNPRERSRTVGFALASMLSSESEFRNTLGQAAAAPAPATESSTGHAAQPTTPTVSAPPSEPVEVRRKLDSNPSRWEPERNPDLKTEREAARARESETGSPPAPPTPPRPPPPTPPQTYAVDLTTVGSTGIGGPARGLGGAARVEHFLWHTLWLAASATVRNGSLPTTMDGGGSDLVLSVMAGLAWRPFFPTAASPFELEIGAQAGLIIHDFSYKTQEGTAAEHNGRLLPGGRLTLEGGFRLNASWEVIAGVGAEGAFGTTEVRVEDQSGLLFHATIPRFRGLAAAGFRFHF